MKRKKRTTLKQKKTDFKTERKWLESKRKKAGKQLNQELNRGGMMDEIKDTARKMFYIANRVMPKTCVQKWSNLQHDTVVAFMRLAKWHLKQVKSIKGE